MRRASLLAASVAALAFAGAAGAQTTITTYDSATNTYRVTTTGRSGTYIITPGGTTVQRNNAGIITIPSSDANAPHFSYNPGGTTPFYAGIGTPFGYTGSSVSRTPAVVGPGGYAGQRAYTADPSRAYGYNYLNGIYYPYYTNSSYGSRYFTR